MMLKAGDYLQNRYEILAPIGTGGMSEVYQARCHVLNRLVAVKVLKEEYCEDNVFVSKFKMEAQTASRLSHPNIVSIYDVIDEGSFHYIVMELIDGVTLKNYILKKGRLEEKLAIGISIQVAQGLAAAHAQHIVHRDVKPQNMIINKDGKVKVADFGIARAVTAQTTGSNAVGSVHYISPEQARGSLSDARSDIYSLGVTMYEMVTGQTPFTGDTPVAVALAHIEQDVTPPEKINGEVSPAYSRIIMRCMEKLPEDRYQDVDSLITDLRRALMNPDERTGTREAERKADVRTTKKNTKASKKAKKNKSGDSGDFLDSVLSAIGIIAALLIAVVILVLAFRFTGLFRRGTASPGTTAPASLEAAGTESAEETLMVTLTEETEAETEAETEPPVIMLSELGLEGMNVKAAQQLLNNRDLGVTIQEEHSDTVGEGLVIRYAPAEVHEGDNVTLTASLGPDIVMIAMPDITGMTEEAANQVLSSLGLSLGTRSERHSKEVPEGQIISQDVNAKTEIPQGSSVGYAVSIGKDTHFVAAVDDVISLQEYFGPSTGDTQLKVSIIMKQIVDGQNVTKVVMEPTDIMGNTSLPVHYSIEGADDVRTGELQVLDLSNDRVLKTYELSFIEVDR